MIETINDADGFVANVWRGLQADPDAVAKRCDWPVNHADLIARKAALIRNENYLLENLCKDEKWFDAELAGYWIWAASCWIGSGLTRPGQIPQVNGTGNGVHAAGQIPQVDGTGKGINEPYNTNIYKWFRELSERLRYVRVVCGDWSRVCGGNWQSSIGVCGMFFDPPYGADDLDHGIYQHDIKGVSNDVREWCKARGVNADYRIVLAGYYEEHAELLDYGWRVKSWSSTGGFANTAIAKETRGKTNRHREALFFSPYCLDAQLQLDFEASE